jgi:hypothetical protein
LEMELAVPVRHVFTGPDGADLVDRGGNHRLGSASVNRSNPAFAVDAPPSFWRSR